MPTVRKTSQEQACERRVERRRGQRLAEPDDGRTGESAARRTRGRQRRQRHASHRARVPRRIARQHESSQSDPCTRIRFDVPARTWRSSTFCVMTVQRSNSRDHRAMTSCAGLGWHAAISSRRQAYHSHTSVGSRPNAAGGRQVLGPELAPQSPAAAEGRHAARGRDAGAGQNRDARRARRSRSASASSWSSLMRCQYFPSGGRPSKLPIPMSGELCLRMFRPSIPGHEDTTKSYGDCAGGVRCGRCDLGRPSSGQAPPAATGVITRRRAGSGRTRSRRLGDRRNQGPADQLHQDRRHRRSGPLHAARAAGARATACGSAATAWSIRRRCS